MTIKVSLRAFLFPCTTLTLIWVDVLVMLSLFGLCTWREDRPAGDFLALL